MTPKRRRLFLFLFGVGCYIVFFYSLFPFDMVIQQFIERSKAVFPGFEIAVERLDPGLIFDTELEEVRIAKRDGETTLPFLAFPEISIDPSFATLVRGAIRGLSGNRGRPNFAVDFNVKGKEGNVDARVETEDARSVLGLSFDGIDMGIFPYLKESLNLLMTGRLYGKADVNWDAAKYTQSNADVDLEFRQFTILPSTLTIAGSEWKIPQIRLSGKENSYLRASLQKGRFQLKQFDLLGEELELSLNGRIQLNTNWSASRLYLKGKCRISEALVKAIPAFSLIEKQKDTDGNYPLTISGTVEKPKIRIGKMTLPI